MKLCMFSPGDQNLERGWPGRIDGDVVVQLAAQTLQAYFTGGGDAREHATYPVADVTLRAPVLHPPSIRIFGAEGDFSFANPAAVIGDAGAIGGFTLLNEFHAPQLRGMKTHDFAISLGPLLVTPDELETAGDWDPLVALVAQNTRLYPGDILAAGGEPLGRFGAGDVVEVGFDPIGTLRSSVVARP